MTTSELIFISAIGIVVEFLIIMFAVRAGCDVSKRNELLRIQNNLLYMIAKKHGYTDSELNEAYQ